MQEPFALRRYNPSIQKFLTLNNISEATQPLHLLQKIYFQQLYEIVRNNSEKSIIVWEDVFNSSKLTNDTIVQIWQNPNKLRTVTDRGFMGLLSACWYLDRYSFGNKWKTFYNCEPFNFVHSENQKFVLGGEACMWGENTDESTLVQRVWPLASATAEILWSKKEGKDLKDAASRLEEHVCRMKMRGIPTQPPNGPSFCYKLF